MWEQDLCTQVRNPKPGEQVVGTISEEDLSSRSLLKL